MLRWDSHWAVVKLLHNFFQKNETDHRLSVGIISPYLGQVRLIKELIYSDTASVQAKKLQKKIKLVKTVDGFQGNEQDIIVISTVRSNRKGQIGFVNDRRRLNVAITRARLRLWIIGDLTTLEHDETWKNFIHFCRIRKLVQAAPDDRTEAERKVDRVVAEASGSGYARPAPAAASGASSSRARPSAANARVAVPQAYIAAGATGDDGTVWNSFFLQQLVTMISKIREETHRRAVVKKITQILAGESSVWKPFTIRDGSNLMLWQKVVEETPTIGNARLIWWVEIDTHGMQAWTTSVALCYSEPPVNRDEPPPGRTEDLTRDGEHVNRSRDSWKWRCYHCNSKFWQWDYSLQSWVCDDCGGTEFFDVTQPRRHATDEGCWVYVPKLNSEERKMMAPDGPPPPDVPPGFEQADSESRTDDPVIDPDTGEVLTRRRRRRRGRNANQPDAVNRQDAVLQPDVLGLDGSQQNRIDSWCSRAGPQKGVRWRGGTPPAPPQWRNSSDLRAFARWEKKIEVWALQIRAFMPLSDAALMLFTSLTGEAELETEHLDLKQVNSANGIKYLVDTLREPLQQKMLFQKRKLLSDYEHISRYPNESVRQFANRYVRVEKDLAAIGISTAAMYDSRFTTFGFDWCRQQPRV
eukprot:s577_g8.t1